MTRPYKLFTLAYLSHIIQKKKENPSDASYTSMLIEKGPNHVCRKLLEEVLEVALESQKNNRGRIVEELADVFYHALVLGACHGIDLDDIIKCLRDRHQKSIRLDDDNMERFSNYRAKMWPCSVEQMSQRAGFQISSGMDVVLFSHNFATGNKHQEKERNLFSPDAKALKTVFQKHNLKVKMGVPMDTRERYILRRSLDILPPVVFVASHAVLPICLSLLASYLKDRIEALRKSRNQRQIDHEVRVVICTDAKQYEGGEWFVFEGNLRKVQKNLENLSKDI